MEETNRTLLVDGRFGIYVPQRFAELYGELAVSKGGIKQAQVDVLLRGVGESNYWDTWDDVMQTFSYVLHKGKTLLLQQEDDLWMVEMEDRKG